LKVEAERIVTANAAALLRSGEAAIQGGDCRFDLSGVKRCDSSAVALVLAWQRAARARGCELDLAGVPPSLKSLAVLYGVDSLIPTGA
jgi:phospholipid transport system transporter-binding protein